MNTDSEMREYLIEKGWMEIWRENYWVHYTYMKGINIDWAGLPLKDAFDYQKRIEENE